MSPQPPTTLGLTPSFGFGDRIGSATPGHVAAMRAAGNGIAPIYAQQSIREMARTGRTPEQVMGDALGALEATGWDGPHGADADHLKEPADVDATAAAGFCFFTIDPSAHVGGGAARYAEGELRDRFAAVRGRVRWIEEFFGQSIPLETGTTLQLDEEACLRAGVKYGLAVEHACALAEHIDAVMEARDYEIELSVDESDEPTTLADHWIVANRCLERGLPLVSLAPRFAGGFEKGVDFKGDRAELERSLDDHAAIARVLGPYKLSLHSGSDKLSVYPALARATRGACHVKTAGTSYLEALRVAARCDEGLFRRIVAFARDRYETDRATYHVSATLDGAPEPDVCSAAELEQAYLERWPDVEEKRGFTAPGRQILHCTFGSVLGDAELGSALRDLLATEPALHERLLAEHFTNHLEALGRGL